MILVMGNKNYSTWSWRAWLAMESFNLPREEVVIPLDQPDTAMNILKHSPSGLVPCLIDGPIKVWDSLAICEYLAEKFPQIRMWPEKIEDRAVARSLCAEMHSSFQNLRKLLPGDIRKRLHVHDLSSAEDDIKRIESIWTQTLAKSSGPFLFGNWTLADCFYAPVVLRFQTYGVKLSPKSTAYMNEVLRHPAIDKLQAQAAAEPWKSARYDHAE